MDLIPLRTDRGALLAELRNAGAQIRNERGFRCPFHGGRHENAGVYQRDDGVWRFKCSSGKCGLEGDIIDVMAWSKGKQPADVIRELSQSNGEKSGPSASTALPTTDSSTAMHAHAPKLAKVFTTFEELKAHVSDNAAKAGQTVEAVYEYRHPETKNLDLAVFRLAGGSGKSFRQAHQSSAEFALAAPDGLRPLYNRSRLLKADRVVVVEGEKCVHALQELGIVATTSPGGSNAAYKADWSALAGKLVVVWRDWDPEKDKNGKPCKRAGDKYQEQVVEALERLEPRPRVRIVNPAALGLPDTGTDCVDYLAQYTQATKEEKRLAVETVLEFAEEIGPASELFAELDAAVAGKRRPIALPWPHLHKATKMLRPGKVIMLAGHPGATKSFWLLALMAFIAKSGIKVAVMELEDSKTYHQRRAFAQEAGCGHLTDDEWCEANPAAVKAAKERHRAFADLMGGVIDSYPTGEINPDGLAKWVHDRAAAGAKVLAIDPITAMDGGSKQWVSDQKFLIQAKRTLTEYECDLILVTHPKTGAKTTGLGDMAGGASYARFCHTGLWLEVHGPADPKANEAHHECFDTLEGQREKAGCNRLLQIRKARDSFGAGMSVGFRFIPETFCFEEYGFLQKEDAA